MEGLELEELESESHRGGGGIDDKLVVKEESDEDSLGKEKEEVIGDLEVVLRGIRGKGAPAPLA